MPRGKSHNVVEELPLLQGRTRIASHPPEATDSHVSRHLEFVNLTGTGKLDQDSRSIVRKHVKRAASQNSRSSNHMSNSARPSNEQPLIVSKFRLTGRPRRFHAKPARPTYKLKASSRHDGQDQQDKSPRFTNPVVEPRNARFNDDYYSFDNVGCGAVDPFQSSPYPFSPKTVSKCIHHSVKLLLPSLTPQSTSGISLAGSHWFSLILSEQVLFPAFLFGSLVHQALLRFGHGEGHDSRRLWEDRDLLHSQLKSIESINQAFQDPAKATSDTVIMSVMTLAFTPASGSFLCKVLTPLEAPLRNLQWLDVYGYFDTENPHLRGLARMVELRGGVEKIEYPGLAAIIHYSGLIYASRTLSRPSVPFISIQNDFEPPQYNLRPAERESRLQYLLNIGLTVDLANVLEAANVYLGTARYSSEGLWTDLDLSMIADQRNFVQHAILSLPRAAEFGPVFYMAHPLYEICRLGCLVFGVGVIFPLPASTAPLPMLATLLKEQLSTKLNLQLPSDVSELLLWAAVLGGIAASYSIERQWFVTALQNMSFNAGLSDWYELKPILERILWLDIAGDSAGKKLWEEANKPPF